MKRLLAFALMLFMPVMVFAQVAAAPGATAQYVPPVWLTAALTYVQGLPKVGPIVLMVLTAVAVVCTLMTALATFLLSVKASIQGIAKLAGAVTVIDTVEAWYQKIAPYVMYLSMYNVQKAPDNSSPQVKS